MKTRPGLKVSSDRLEKPGILVCIWHRLVPVAQQADFSFTWS